MDNGRPRCSLACCSARCFCHASLAAVPGIEPQLFGFSVFHDDRPGTMGSEPSSSERELLEDRDSTPPNQRRYAHTLDTPADQLAVLAQLLAFVTPVPRCQGARYEPRSLNTHPSCHVSLWRPSRLHAAQCRRRDRRGWVVRRRFFFLATDKDAGVGVRYQIRGKFLMRRRDVIVLCDSQHPRRIVSVAFYVSASCFVASLSTCFRSAKLDKR